LRYTLLAMELTAIGTVQSTLDDRARAPKQGNEGAPDAWISIDARFAEGLEGLRVDDDVFVFTWLHHSSRDVLRVHPRDDLSNPLQGVFGTRSPDRPNPVGLHRVRILAIDGNRLQVRNLEALDGTPIIDIKPVIGADEQRA
jgi:tRNA-Thr(GGU) m(6)t(6)A37 methyltransferase TsaA